jgi:hypothetical protein
VLPPYLNDTQAQLNELQINLHWLKDTVWKLRLANGNGHDAELSYSFLPMVAHFPGNLGLQGFGFLEKLLSITYDLAEALSLQPAPRTSFTPGPHDQLRKILNIVTTLRNGNNHFLPLLLSKVHAALPKMASPMLQNAPESAACNIDIFEGFGNAGMAQPPGFSHDSYDNKFSVPRLDDHSSSDSNSPNITPPSSNDMNSPFVSSPPIMSPGGMDLSHGLSAEFTSMPEMVMSPISHAPPSSLGAPVGMNNHQPQHSQHTPLSPFSNLGSQMQGLNNHNINPPPNISLASQMHLGQGIGGNLGSNLMSRPQPQRTGSFALGPPPIRTVGDFQALQRTNSDMTPMSPLSTMGIGSMGNEMDFNTLPR